MENKDWGWEQAVTKLRGRNVFFLALHLPVLLRTPVAQEHRQTASYAKFGLVQLPNRWSATIFIANDSLREIHMLCKIFSTFSTFSILNPMGRNRSISTHCLLSESSPSLTMADPRHRSLFTQVIPMSLSLQRCRSDLDLRRNRAWQTLASAATALELCKWQYAMESMDERGQWTI